LLAAALVPCHHATCAEASSQRESEGALLARPTEVWQARPRTAAGHRGAARGRRLAAGLAVAAGLVVGSCSVQFGNGSDSPEQSSSPTPRDRNRLYLEEQERQERQYQFDKVGPSDR
jgi:hypothetical protein